MSDTDEWISKRVGWVTGPVPNVDFVQPDAPPPPGIDMSDEAREFYKILFSSKPSFVWSGGQLVSIALAAKTMADLRDLEQQKKDLTAAVPKPSQCDDLKEMFEAQRVLKTIENRINDNHSIIDRHLRAAKTSYNDVMCDLDAMAKAMRQDFRAMPLGSDPHPVEDAETMDAKTGDDLSDLFAK